MSRGDLAKTNILYFRILRVHIPPKCEHPFYFYLISNQELVVDGVGDRIERVDHPERPDDRGRAVHRFVGRSDQLRQDYFRPDRFEGFGDAGNLNKCCKLSYRNKLQL